MPDTQYGIFSKILHHLALGNRLIAEASLDLERTLQRVDTAPILNQKHVFIAGLARAGTTVLMRRFFASGAFQSLTYRDMPFVLMPNLWAKISNLSPKHAAKKQRAHGDGLTVDYDTPEALEEVFWRVFAGTQYIHQDHLTPMHATEETIDQFRNYIAAILARNDTTQPKRYLSKNNNNILRLPAIRQAFPNATVIIPFRSPTHHAHSLLRQHQHFTQEHSQNPFTQKYMTWLAHHEFGADHRPFRFDDQQPTHQDPETLNYWLELWLSTHRWLLKNDHHSLVFQSYESLCTDLDNTWQRLAAITQTPNPPSDPDPIHQKNQPVNEPIDPTLLQQADDLYQSLRQRESATPQTMN